MDEKGEMNLNRSPYIYGKLVLQYRGGGCVWPSPFGVDIVLLAPACLTLCHSCFLFLMAWKRPPPTTHARTVGTKPCPLFCYQPLYIRQEVFYLFFGVVGAAPLFLLALWVGWIPPDAD